MTARFTLTVMCADAELDSGGGCGAAGDRGPIAHHGGGALALLECYHIGGMYKSLRSAVRLAAI